MRLTNLEIYKSAQEKYDKANNPHITQKNFVYIYEEARNEWLALADKDFEITEKRRSDFRGFISRETFQSSQKIQINDKVLYLKAVSAFFDFNCNGIIKELEVSVPSRSWDEITPILRNPFYCPTNEEPVYVEYSNQIGPLIEIYSTSIPKRVDITYIKRPLPYALLTNPSGTTEENREQQEYILDLCIAKIKLKFNQQFGYQAMVSSEIPRNE
jgi:hypothetical protein